MATATITSVRAAVDKLRANGVEPSIRNIQREIGGGNREVIKRYMTAIEAEEVPGLLGAREGELENLPEGVKAAVADGHSALARIPSLVVAEVNRLILS